MSKSWNEFSDDERQEMEQNFSLKQSSDLLLAADGSSRELDVPLFSELVAIISDPASEFSDAMLESIRGNAKLSADFDLLLRRLAICAIPRAAAASSGELTTREVGEFRLKLVPSRAAQGQIFLIVSTPESIAESPGRIIVKVGSEELICRMLPSPEGQNISLLLYEDEPLVKAIANPASELFLI